MWIFCCGMYRSGSTLQYQLTSELVEHFGLGKRIEWEPENNFKRIKDKYQDYKGLKVYKTHNFIPEHGAELQAGNAKSIYIFRDLRDVISSFSKKFGPSIEELVFEQKQVENCIFEYQKWTSNHPVLISKYEVVVKNLYDEIVRISNFLNLPKDEEYFKQLAIDFSMEAQKVRIKNFSESKLLQFGEKSVVDPHHLIHTNHINKGAINGWINELSVREINEIEKRGETWLKENGYEKYKTSHPLKYVFRYVKEVIKSRFA